MVQQAWRAGAPGPCDCSPSPGSTAAVSGSALSICKALLMRRDASPSRVLVGGRTVYRRGGDASGKRSASDGYSGWDARARTSASARLALTKQGGGRPVQGAVESDDRRRRRVLQGYLKASISWLAGSRVRQLGLWRWRALWRRRALCGIANAPHRCKRSRCAGPELGAAAGTLRWHTMPGGAS